MNNCKICPRSRSQHSEYCCPEHYKLDTQRYSGESLREAVERKAAIKKLGKVKKTWYNTLIKSLNGAKINK